MLLDLFSDVRISPCSTGLHVHITASLIVTSMICQKFLVDLNKFA